MGVPRQEMEVQAEDREKVAEPPMFKVLLHNDDYTTMEFVVMILETVFHKSAVEATKIMLNVHNNGIGVAGVYTREVAETKIALVHGIAQQYEHPLQCSMEPV